MVFILLLALVFSGWVFAAIFFIITLLGLWEFYGLITSPACQPQKVFGTLTGLAVYITFTVTQFSGMDDGAGPWGSLLPLLLIIPATALSFILEIYRNRPNPLTNISTTLLGIIYVAIPLSLLNAFSGPDNLKFHGLPEILVGYFVLTWFYDTGAYLFGKQFGRHKFFERISPKKTWEGTIAGGIVTLLTAVGLSYLFSDISLTDWLVIASLVLVFGTHGDLAESLLKRSLNVKDSGTILPGHGGILDRFDTILLSAPFVFLYIFLKHAS